VRLRASCTSTVPPTSCPTVPLLLSSTSTFAPMPRPRALLTSLATFPSLPEPPFTRFQVPSANALCRLSVRLIRVSIASPFISHTCALFFSLAALFSTSVLYFQSLAHSLAKTPGVGVRRQNGLLESATYRLCVGPCLQTGYPSPILLVVCFMVLQIPFPATLFLSHPYETPGV
jgi:hypothetical protein